MAGRATESALMLAPGGEFAFVLVGAAIDGGIVGHAIGSNVEIAVTLSRCSRCRRWPRSQNA